MRFTYRYLLLILMAALLAGALLLTGCKGKPVGGPPVQNDSKENPSIVPTDIPAIVPTDISPSDIPVTVEDLEVLPNITEPEQPTCPPSQNGTNDLSPVPIKDSPDMTAEEFSISEITDDIYARIYGKSYPVGCTLDLDELRYLTVLHYGFDGEVHVGELIVNKKIASATLEIFEELYAIEYPIEKMKLIDEYDADDEASMEDNNSSAFNYRYIAETTVLSNHALGFAIDINTLYNPYVYTRKDGSAFLQPVNAGDYVDRSSDCPYYIRKDDDCYEIFTAHGFAWGGDWETKKDYQHFEYKY